MGRRTPYEGEPVRRQTPRDAGRGLVLYAAAAGAAAGGPAPPGLGSIQPLGRAQVLEQLLQRPLAAGPRAGAPAGGGLLRAAPGADDGLADLGWSNLSDVPRQAVKQWVAGQLGGRHCMLILLHSTGDSCLSGALEETTVKLNDLRAGAALNALSGLHVEAPLIAEQDGCWLFEHVFSKSPQQVIEEALQAALQEINDPNLARPGGLSMQQVHLALRRRAMKVLHDSSVTEDLAGRDKPHTDENTRVQVWLELVRLQAEGRQPAADAAPPHAGGYTGAAARSKSRPPPEKKQEPAQPKSPEQTWLDGILLRELGKQDAELEADSEQMSLEALRGQNRLIEDYVMRLVRQRDDLKQVAKVAEERDSYFILGLEGPDVSDATVKKAYRNMARKEHPDKAGVGNHRRFQAIQQAYNNIQKQRKEGGPFDAAADEPEGAQEPEPKVSTAVAMAAQHALQARDCADRVAIAAHRALRSGEEGAEAKALPQRRALKALRDLTASGTVELRNAAVQLRALGAAVFGVAQSAEEVLEESADSEGTVAGIGLRDRVVIAVDTGRSIETSAEMLEKISEATVATLRKVEAADAGPPSGAARGRQDESAGLVKLGSRLLGESLARITAISRRSADEALSGAMKALELSRAVAILDAENRKQQRKEAAKRNGRADDDDDAPMAAPDAEREEEEEEEDDEAQDGEGGERGGERAGRSPKPKGEGARAKKKQEEEPKTPQDQLKSAARRVKERHVSLRVKNLRLLVNLNEEALRTQVKLRGLLERSEGALLPEVSVDQKRHVFDLVEQLLDFALAESSKGVGSLSVPPAKTLERSLGFALALEHVGALAMPADSRTQALKFAAFLDMDLLCQVIDGPFSRRLVELSAKRRAAAEGQPTGGVSSGYGSRSRSMGLAANPAAHAAGAAAARAWEEAALAACARVVQLIQQATTPPKCEESGGS